MAGIQLDQAYIVFMAFGAATGLWQDLRYGWRMLAGSPGFAWIAIVSLAIGIGATCAVFSFADALLLRPLPVSRPAELFPVGVTTAQAFGGRSLVSSYRDYIDIRDRSRTLGGVAAFKSVPAAFAAGAGAVPKLKLATLAGGNLFAVIGVKPALGRAFRPDEDQVLGRDAVVVLGHGLWEEEFAADPNVLGRQVRIAGRPFTVIGVAPRTLTGLEPFFRCDFYVPLMMGPWVLSDATEKWYQARDARNITLKARLAPGVSLATAQAELTAIAADLAREYPDTNRNTRLSIRTELQARLDETPESAEAVVVLGLLAIAVLFVACANVAGLLTSRAPARAREMALRLAVGAGRGRIVRQLLTESLLMAIPGAAGGVIIGYAGVAAFRRMEFATDLPLAIPVRLDHRAVLFSILMAFASALLFGLLPAIRAARTDLTAVMKSGDGLAPGGRRRWGRAVLVCGQIVVSIVVLVLALGIYRDVGRDLARGPGYRTDHLLMMSVAPGLVRYTDARSAALYASLADRARALPGVTRVALTTAVPMSNEIDDESIVPEGYQLPPGTDKLNVLAARVDEHFFETIGVGIVRGRGFSGDDRLGSPPVAIVNEQAARRFWPEQEAIGKRLRLNDENRTQVQVVGIAKTTTYGYLGERPQEFVYFPYRQKKTVSHIVMLIQSAGDPAGLAAPLREIVRDLDADLPVFNVRTMEEFYRIQATSGANVMVGTVAALGVMALGLAFSGLYGLVWYNASRRTRELGIRIAVGATRTTVVALILRQAIVLAAVGVACGAAASVAVDVVFDAVFPGPETQRNFAAVLAVIPVVLAVTFAAAYLPARRACRVNPMDALRVE